MFPNPMTITITINGLATTALLENQHNKEAEDAGIEIVHLHDVFSSFLGFLQQELITNQN